MSMKQVRNVFLWCAIINYGVLLTWFLFFMLGPGWMYRLWSGWNVSTEQFALVNFTGIMLYKIGIILFNLVPYIGLRIVGLKSTGE